MGLFIKDKPVMDVKALFEKLKVNPKNPRTISDDEFEKLKHSLRSFPKMLELRPIIYDDEFVVLGGNMRSRAIEALIPEGFILKPEYFKNASELTEEQKKEFILKDNIPLGSWDYDLLANEFDDLPLEEWGLDPTEWSNEEPEQQEDKTSSKKDECLKCKEFHDAEHSLP